MSVRSIFPVGLASGLREWGTDELSGSGAQVGPIVDVSVSYHREIHTARGVESKIITRGAD